jgi:hypothetical protein
VSEQQAKYYRMDELAAIRCPELARLRRIIDRAAVALRCGDHRMRVAAILDEAERHGGPAFTGFMGE